MRETRRRAGDHGRRRRAVRQPRTGGALGRRTPAQTAVVPASARVVTDEIVLERVPIKQTKG